VYFAGPRSRWEQSVNENEVIFKAEAPWLWLARVLARGNVGNTDRCGYAIEADGKLIEHVEATRE
jgi:hypothetical protein